MKSICRALFLVSVPFTARADVPTAPLVVSCVQEEANPLKATITIADGRASGAFSQSGKEWTVTGVGGFKEGRLGTRLAGSLIFSFSLEDGSHAYAVNDDVRSSFGGFLFDEKGEEVLTICTAH